MISATTAPDTGAGKGCPGWRIPFRGNWSVPSAGSWGSPSRFLAPAAPMPGSTPPIRSQAFTAKASCPRTEFWRSSAGSCQEAAPRFHARLNAKGKTYRYRIWNSPEPCVFQRRYVWADPEGLDLEAMKAAGAILVGEHDFSAFCGNKKMKKSTLRRIDRLDIRREGKEITITVTGDGFLYNMVRILVGTLVEVGRGDRAVGSIPALFGGKREQAGFLAPGQGLGLMEVFY